MPQSDSVLKRFDRAASRYHASAEIQRRVADHLIESLRPVPVPGRILEVGCGSGLLTGRLVARYPDSRVDALDVSARMVREAARGLSQAPQVFFFVADIRRLRRRARYDLAVSSSALHWALPLETAIRRMTAALLPDGWFAAALMTEGTLGELHRLRADLSPGNIPTAKLPSLEGVCRAVRSAGLRLESARELALESEHASAGALLADLHATGVTGGRYSMGARPLTRGELARLKERYQSQYGDRNGRVRASWRVALVIARPGFKS